MPQNIAARWSAAVLLVLAACGSSQQPAPVVQQVQAPSGRDYVTATVALNAGPVSQSVARTQLGAVVPAAGRRPAIGVRPFQGAHAEATPVTRRVPGDVQFDVHAAEAFLSTLSARVNRPFLPGRVDFATRTVVPHQAGYMLDRATAMPLLEQALASGASTITIPVAEQLGEEGRVPPGLSFDAVVGEWTTRFSRYGDYRNRGRNVQRATRALNGSIIPVGGRFSFNGRVGARTRRRGYLEAPVIVRGELVDGMGGGVCQVSSTLYAAAFFSGLDFPEHTAHSRPSSYIRAGLDATVSWPEVDLVIENPFDFPLYVHATTERNRLTVQLYGASKPRQVELERRQARWRPFDTRTRDDPMLSEGIREVTQEGRRGRTVYRTRTIREGERSWVERDEVTYPPVDEIIHVGTSRSFDLLFSNAGN